MTFKLFRMRIKFEQIPAKAIAAIPPCGSEKRDHSAISALWICPKSTIYK